jgi:hypothetical protein
MQYNVWSSYGGFSEIRKQGRKGRQGRKDAQREGKKKEQVNIAVTLYLYTGGLESPLYRVDGCPD